MDLLAPLPDQQRRERCLGFHAGVFQHHGLQRHRRPTPQRAVDGHACRDRAQPAPEATRVFELVNLAHRLEEHVLAQLLGLGMVVQPPIHRGVDGALVALDQPAKGLAVATLGRVNGFLDRAVTIGSWA